MIKNFFLLLGLMISLIQFTFSQNEDGYWDQERKTEKTIPLADGKRTWIRVDIPTGTTQIVFRISFLDENGEMRNSLSSTFANMPSGTAQGTSMALNLLNVIGGSNKGRYYIFTNKEDADNYYTSGHVQNSCYMNINDISGDKDVLYINKNACLKETTEYLWFAFYNANVFDDEKIILEVLPWIDKKASRGWSHEMKQEFIVNCKSFEGVNNLLNAEGYCQCLLDKLQNNYKLQDFQQLTSTEIDKVSESFGKDCLAETGELDNLYDQQRKDADSLGKEGKYKEAVASLLDIITNGRPTAMDYNNIGYYYLFTKQYLKAIKYLKEGEKLDETELLIKGNLAHAYLLNGDIEQAKIIYTKYKTQNVTEDQSWVNMVKSDFELFKKFGLPTENFENVINVLK